MLASEIITDVRRELLEPVSGFWSDAELLRSLNRAQMDFVNRTRVLEDTAFLTTTVGVQDYPLPDNWTSAKLVLLNAKEEETDDDAWKRLRPTNLEKMGQEHPNFRSDSSDAQATPHQYWIWNDRISLFNTPRNSIAGDLYLYYKSKPRTIIATTESIEVDDSLAEGLTAYILWKAWAKSKETTLATEQRQIYEKYVGEGRRWAKRRSGDQRYKVDIESATPFGGNDSFGPIF